MCVCVLSCVWHFSTPVDCRPSGSPAHGILQGRILEWVAISYSRRSCRPRDQPVLLFYFIIFNILISFLSSDPHTNTESWQGRDCYLLCVHVSVYVCVSVSVSVCVCVCMCMLSLFSHVQLCNPMECSTPDSSVHRILQARILEWVAMPSSRGSSRPRDWTRVSYASCIGRWGLYH